MAIITHIFQLKEGVGYAPGGYLSISGTTSDGFDLTADTSTIQSAYGIVSPTFKWYKDDVLIGNTTNTYSLTQADVGSVFKAEVTFNDTQNGGPYTFTSQPTAAITNLNDPVSGVLLINGTQTQGQTLSANTSGISDGDGLGVFSYKWQRDGSDISGATASSYTLTQADVGSIITLVVSYTDGGGTEETITASTSAIVNINDAPTGTVSISGTAAEDQTLTASNTLADADGMGPVSYQWKRDGVNISGATGSSYTLTQADVGSRITVAASYTDGEGTLETRTSAQTAIVANVNDAPTGTVTITGSAIEDQTLTASNTIADEDGLGAITYQWKRNGTNISGATASTYTLTQADVGSTITVTASYTDGQGTAEAVTSSPTGTVSNLNDAPSGSVTISGSVTENSTLTANTGTITDPDGLGAFSYQWKRDGANISGATASTYTLTAADVGSQISVTVSYTDQQGTAESLTSAQTAAVANANDAPQGVPTITGTQTQGQTLTADASGITDADGLGPFSYQWTRNGTNISGATNTTYTLTQADVGTLIRVRVSYTDGFGTNESVTSAPTGAIANVNDTPTGNVTISGTATEDQTLTASNNINDLDGMGPITYQWKRNGTNISGANSSSYTLTQADVGAAISVTATYTDGEGTVETVTSTSTAPVANVNDNPTGSISISGSALVGNTLTSSNTIADQDGLGSFSYQWIRGTSTPISGATSSSYTVQSADKGFTLKLQITYTDGQGTVETVTSGTTAIVNSPNVAPTGSVTISSTGTEPGDTLTANTGTLADGNGLGTFSYQWKRNGSNISGATNSTYVLTASDVGSSVSVTVSYTDGDGYFTSLTSTNTITAAYSALSNFLSNRAITNGGNRVAISADGNYAVVGNSSANSATVLLRSGNTWNVQQTLTGSGNFGIDVGIDDTGSTIVVGANLVGSSQGAAYAYVRSGSTWSQQTLPILNALTGHGWGQGVAISGDGQWIIVGGPGVDIPQTNGGQVQSFSRNVNTFEWNSHVGIVVASGDGYAHRLALNFDGQVATATSLYTAEVQYSRRNLSGGWYNGILVADGTAGFGDDVKLSNDGLWMVVSHTEDGGSTPGKVYVYQRTSITSSFSLRYTINDPAGTNLNKFGEGVGISSDGSRIVVGAPSDNKAYVFIRQTANGSLWAAGQVLTRSGSSQLGRAVDISADGSVVIIGENGGVSFFNDPA